MDAITIVIAIIAASALLLPRIIKVFKKTDTPSRDCGVSCSGCGIDTRPSGSGHCSGGRG